MELQQRARDAFRRFQADPSHSGLQFKPVHARLAFWSARINDSYRAVGLRRGEEIIWFFIGTHAAYDRLLATS